MDGVDRFDPNCSSSVSTQVTGSNYQPERERERETEGERETNKPLFPGVLD